jgi:signal transduction histidine kinase
MGSRAGGLFILGGLKKQLSVECRSEINAQLLVDDRPDLEEAAEIAIYCIAMEALNNILKHSGASSVVITLRSVGSKVSLEVADDGLGFDLSQAEALSGMGARTHGTNAYHQHPGEARPIQPHSDGTVCVA